MRLGGDRRPVRVGNDRTVVPHRLGADDGRDAPADRQRLTAQVGGEKARGEGIAGTVAVDGVAYAIRLDAVQLVAARNPRAILAQLYDSGAAVRAAACAERWR